LLSTLIVRRLRALLPTTMRRRAGDSTSYAIDDARTLAHHALVNVNRSITMVFVY
jgi:hypothetical protein